MNQLIYSIAFTFLRKLPMVNNRQKISESLPSLKGLFTLSQNSLIKNLKLHPQLAQSIYSQRKDCMKKAEQHLKEAERRSVKIIDKHCKEYPPLLKHIPDKPIILHIKGESKLDYSKMLSVVGTRNATHYGIQQTNKFINEMPGTGTCIVSGLALGIDTQAHISAIENNLPTIAVLGHGLDIIYPSTNKELAERILNNGGTIISEMPFGTPILAGIFPRRNRIIAGISHATLVVEASIKGGALITAAFANGYNRTVFAIAGRNDSCFSQGCNDLIKQNSAMLVDRANDIFEAMNWESTAIKGTKTLNNTDNLLQKEVQILQIIEMEKPCSLDTLFEKTNLPVPEILSILTKLEISNFIKETSTCHYESCG